MVSFKLLTLAFAATATASTFFSEASATSSTTDHAAHTVATSFSNISDSGMMTAISTAAPTAPVECKGTTACIVTINGTATTIQPVTESTTVVTSTFNNTDTYYSSATGTGSPHGSARPSNGTVPVNGAGSGKVGVALGLAALVAGVIGA
jgi:hypothetical protein